MTSVFICNNYFRSSNVLIILLSFINSLIIGKSLKHDRYSYMVGVGTIHEKGHDNWSNVSSCMGTLLTNTTVLTAAHCQPLDTVNYKMYVFKKICPRYTYRKKNKMYSTNEYRVVKDFEPHEQYKPDNHNHDVMILYLERPFDTIKTFAKLYGCTDMFSRSNTNVAQDLKCFGISCGNLKKKKNVRPMRDVKATKYGKLRKMIAVNASYIPNHCIMGQGWKYGICTKSEKQMICPGDDGGPLFYYVSNEMKQIGILRNTFHNGTCENVYCGCKQTETVHIFLYMYKTWIYEKTKIILEDCSISNAKAKKNSYRSNVIMSHNDVPSGSYAIRFRTYSYVPFDYFLKTTKMLMLFSSYNFLILTILNV